MKNLKKVLSLVLALAMALSLMTVAFAKDTDFSDSADIEYTEAVEVMAAIGVLEGSDGKFNPNGILTREQAAKIITYMLLGKDAAEKLTTSAAPFADVAADRWSAGSIAYCAEKGIIVGSNGKFNPTGKLTGHAFAKMLLVALGYDAKIQGYEGGKWAVNVASDAVVAGIDIDGVLMGNELTREQAAQMAFQTLEADMVKYASKGTNIELPDGTTVVTGASDAAPYTGGTEYNRVTDATTSTNLQFCEQYFSKLKKVNGATDDFGRPAGHKWTLDNKDVFNATEKPVATFTAKTSADDVAKALSGYKFVDNSSATTTYKIENNTKYTTAKTVKVTVVVRSSNAPSAATATRLVENETTAAEIAGITKNGCAVEVYANDKNVITEIVAISYKTVEAGKVTTDKKTGNVTYSIDNSNYVDYADEDATDSIVLAGPVAKGDIVTYVKVSASKIYVYPTTSFEGTQTATKTKDSVQTITIDGKAYTVGEYAKNGTSFANSKDAATYYVDQYGFVVHTDSKATASTDYAMVIALDADLKTSFSSKTPSLKARVVLADGTIGEYDVALTEGEDTNAGKYWIKNIGSKDNYLTLTSAPTVKNTALVDLGMADTDDGNIDNPAIFGYTLDGNTITFEKLTALQSGNTAENTVYTVAVGDSNDYISNSNTSYTVNTDQSVLVNSATKFVAYNTAKNTAAVYTGVSNLPKSVSNTQTGYAVLKTGTTNKVGTASVVFFTINSALTADSTDDMVYVDGSYSTVMIDGKDKYQYTGYKADGTTIELIGATNSQNAGLYVPNKDNEISGSPKIHSDNALIINSAKLTVDGEMVKSGNNWYYITDDTQIVYIDSDLSEVNDNTGTLILVKDTQNVDVIYVTAD